MLPCHNRTSTSEKNEAFVLSLASATMSSPPSLNVVKEEDTAKEDGLPASPVSGNVIAQDFVQRLMKSQTSRTGDESVRGSASVTAAVEGNAIAQEFVNRMLHARPSGVHTGGATGKSDREVVQKANIRGVLFPWMTSYKIWWYTTIVATLFTVFFCPINIGFQKEPGLFNDAAAVIEGILSAVFALDIVVKFNLAFHKEGVLVFQRKQIIKNYMSRMFWVDLIAVFPFGNIALGIANLSGQESSKALLLSLLNLLTLVRVYRLRKFSNLVQFNARISLVTYTLLRNFSVALAVTNFSGCIMYFIARVDGFGDDTWIGPIVDGLSGVDRYITSLYWSTVTVRSDASQESSRRVCCVSNHAGRCSGLTVRNSRVSCSVALDVPDAEFGRRRRLRSRLQRYFSFAYHRYGDFSPVNSAEMVWGIIFMFFNMVVQR